MSVAEPVTARTEVLEQLATMTALNAEFSRHLGQRSAAGSGIASIGVVGGGTAGYLAALALQRAFGSEVTVAVLESPRIPIIGVGESTVSSILPFLHRRLGIDPAEFFREVQPTWKLGIRFEWGPGSHFQAPFDWAANSVGVLGSMAHTGSVNAMTLGSLLMEEGRAPILNGQRGPLSLLAYTPFAYHFDSYRLNDYLLRVLRSRGVVSHDVTVEHVVVGSDGETVEELVGDAGERLRFDLYVDASGFRSVLLGTALRTPWLPYRSSLLTDRAVTFNLPHGGVVKPYTTSTTMDAGWCWNIPMRHEDHLGYVHSSDHIDDSAVEAELARRYGPDLELRTIPFRTGRHEQAWRGNVVALGNAYAFVEPLQSSAIAMMCEQVTALVDLFPSSPDHGVERRTYNRRMASLWDSIRWYIAMHYRFNRRLDTRFWRECNAEVDVSGVTDLLDAFASRAPLRFWGSSAAKAFEDAAPTIYGLPGVDCVLLGLGASTNVAPPPEPRSEWESRADVARQVVRAALPAADALAAVDDDAALLTSLVHSPRSWVNLS